MAAESTVRILFLGDSAQAVRSVSRLESSMSGLGRTAKLLAGAVGIAVVGGMAAATKAAIDFQKQMELVHTQAGASTQEVEKMSKALLGLASSVGTAPEDLAKSLYHVESAGIRAHKALAIVKAAAQGAKIGQADLETTTNALVGAFKSGVKGAGDFQHTMAVMIATVGAGNMRMSDLTSAMGTGLLSAAKGVGISIQDVGAALAELTIQGQGATDSATRLQMAFLTMAANTTKGDAALKSIGITQNQLATDMREHGLIFALQDLQTHLQDSGKTLTEQTAIIADVFGRRSLKAILPLLQNLADVQKRQDAINKSVGNYGEAWRKTEQEAAFKLEQAKASIQAAAIPLGNILLPLVAKVAVAVSHMATRFGEFTAKLGDAKGIAAKFKVIAGGAEDMAKAVVKAVQDALLGFTTFSDPSKLTGRFHADAVASTFHDGLVQKLEALDWSVIGQKIGEGIVKGVQAGGKIAQALINAISTALTSANWDQIARQAGPLIVTALASAISAALDPSFWIHHWDLALSIALVAFGGAIGKIAGRLGLLLLRPFADLAPAFGRVVGSLVLSVAERLPKALQGVFLEAAVLAGRALNSLVGLAGAIADRVVSQIGTRVAKIPGLLRFTLRVLGVDAAIHAIGSFASYVISQLKKAVDFVISEFNKLPGIVKTAFDIGPIGAMIGSIQTLISTIQTLIGWIDKIPHFVHTIFSSSGSAGPAGGPRGGGPPVRSHAAGGFVAGSSGSPQLILAHAGEVILNPMQQAAFGGAGFFKQAFGFTEGGSSFAAGGIVGKPKRRHSGKSPHHPRNSRVKAKSRAANAILAALDEIDENESNADRAYGQLVRQFDITQETFIRTDPVTGADYISQPDINQRVSEIDQLITARDNYLALLDEEKKELEKAIQRLKAAIAALVAAIKHEREQAASDAQMVAVLGKQLGQEQAKKKPNPKVVNSLNAQITARGNSRSKHLSNVGTMTSTLSGFRASLAGVQENLSDTLPMDQRDVTLDIAQLQAERKDVTGTTLPTSSGGGGSAGVAVSTPDVSALLAQIAQLNLALGIQTAQSALIGSFAKGTLSVPQTGLALVHAGESITPAGQSRGGSGSTSQPVEVHLHVDDAMSWLTPFIRAEAVNASEAISVRIGTRATERARSGRY